LELSQHLINKKNFGVILIGKLIQNDPLIFIEITSFKVLLLEVINAFIKKSSNTIELLSLSLSLHNRLADFHTFQEKTSLGFCIPKRDLLPDSNYCKPDKFSIKI